MPSFRVFTLKGIFNISPLKNVGFCLNANTLNVMTEEEKSGRIHRSSFVVVVVAAEGHSMMHEIPRESDLRRRLRRWPKRWPRKRRKRRKTEGWVIRDVCRNLNGSVP